MKAEDVAKDTGNSPGYHFLDLVDISLIDQLFESFYMITGMQYSILDPENNILIMKGWQDICTKFHRVCPCTELRCQQSDSYILDHLQDGPYVAYQCNNGLMEYATPIIVEGQHLATIFLGQILHDPPDEDFFRRQAREYGFDEDGYIDALQRVPVHPRDKVITVVEFYSQVARVLANMGLESIRQEGLAKVLWRNPEPICVTTLDDGRYVKVNDAWIEATGYSWEEAIGRTSSELGIWPSEDERQRFIEQLEINGNLRNLETAFRMRSGEVRDFLISAEIIKVFNRPLLLMVSKDITERKKDQEALRLSEERFSKAFNASPNAEAISTLNDGRFILVNESFCRIVGFQRNEIIGKTPIELGIWVNPADGKKMRQMLLRDVPVRDMEFNFRRKSGEIWIGLFSAVKIDIDGGTCQLSIAGDITDRKRSEEEIKYLSFHDKLTGLYNRAFFEAELERLDTERQLPISLIMGDVNGLKLINDALGHHEGDNVLITVAATLKSSCREEDIVARWGGDEFIILLPRCDKETASKILKRINNRCEDINNLPIQTSISLGLASKNLTSTDLKEVIREAEDKMYRHKLLADRSTRNSFILSLENTLWARSHETKEHCERIRCIAQTIGQAIALPDSEMDNIKLVSLLHDIGKIAIPNNILDKPGKLSPEEWETIRKHPETGYRIALSSPDIAPIADAILYHHERWDGNGYPMGLRGDEIPLISRIIAIADAYDVMINGRPYQKAHTREKVLEELAACAGTQFDPQLVKRALEVFSKL
ncbi:MAG: PocR ligand-binding domain-containing protein [Chitinophagales bacterium]